MSEIPEAAVQAAGEALKRYMVGDDYDLERVPPDVPLDAADGWVSAIDGAAKDAMPAVLIAALPHLLTDEMVERAADANRRRVPLRAAVDRPSRPRSGPGRT
jgi:hypothetical protein